MLKRWKYQLIFDCFLPEHINIGHLLCQLCYLIISFNLHDSFMKCLLFLSYDTCKIGLANWTWPKVKRKLSGGTRTNRRPPVVGLISFGLNTLPSLAPGFLSTFCPWSVCLWLTLATSMSRSFLPVVSNGCSQTKEIRRESGRTWMIKVACHISKQSLLGHLATSHYWP